jgi:RNA polymerase sigma-70 factor (ECF subfamily)
MEIDKTDDSGLQFADLVNDFYTPLYRFAYSLAKNESDACDLTQQTYYIWAQKGSSLRDASKVKSWLFTTLYREFLRVRRRSSKTTSYEPELLELELPPVTPDVASTMDAADAVASLVLK